PAHRLADCTTRCDGTRNCDARAERVDRRVLRRLHHVLDVQLANARAGAKGTMAARLGECRAFRGVVSGHRLAGFQAGSAMRLVASAFSVVLALRVMAADDLAQRTVVVVNSRDPESIALGEYYLARRA